MSSAAAFAASSCCQRVDRGREAELAPGPAERLFHLAPERRPVECGRGIRPMRVHRLALDELALDGVERRELVVSRLERAEIGLDAEQRAHEILEMRSERDQELGLRLRREGAGFAAGRTQPGREGGVRRLEVRDEQAVDPCRTLHRIEVGERESVRQLERGRGELRHGVAGRAAARVEAAFGSTVAAKRMILTSTASRA